MRLVTALAFALCMACGGGNKKHTDTTPTPDPIPKTAGPACSAVGEHLATLADRDPAASPDTAAAKKYSAACTTDAWSDDQRSCLATATSDDEVTGCLGTMTEIQKKPFHDVVKQEPASAAAADSAPPPPPAPKKSTTRGPTKKAGDPCQGGE